MTLAFGCCAAITSVSALTSLGFSIAALASSSRAARTAPLYTMARSVALVAASVAAFFVSSPAWLEAAAFSMILVQAGDGLVGLHGRQVVKTIGPFLTAIANSVALYYLIRFP